VFRLALTRRPSVSKIASFSVGCLVRIPILVHGNRPNLIRIANAFKMHASVLKTRDERVNKN